MTWSELTHALASIAHHAWRAVQDRGNPAFVYQWIQELATRGDTDLLRDVLRSFFRKIKPHLLAEVERAA